jgi:hypothetical protein
MTQLESAYRIQEKVIQDEWNFSNYIEPDDEEGYEAEEGE